MQNKHHTNDKVNNENDARAGHLLIRLTCSNCSAVYSGSDGCALRDGDVAAFRLRVVSLSVGVESVSVGFVAEANTFSSKSAIRKRVNG